LNKKGIPSNDCCKSKERAKNVLEFHLEDTLDLKIALARKIIAKFCQKVKVTPNQDKINPNNHASKKREATTMTIAKKATPRAVEVFIGLVPGQQ
jgi:hypothetical protein